MSLITYANKMLLISPSWYDVFMKAYNQIVHIDSQLNIPYIEMDDTNKYYLSRDSETILPHPTQIFSIFEMIAINNIRVVILGQDPYPNYYYSQFALKSMPNAHGLSFSVPRDAPIPSSLNNIFDELRNSISNFVEPQHGNLTSWVQQGVFLLNTALTVYPKGESEHVKLWAGFTNFIIHEISKANPHCIYILLGKHAKTVADKNVVSGHKLFASHPSGLSFARGDTPFRGSNIFAKCNAILSKLGQPVIDWNVY
jgi:uracil-DNA glycosylase